jgi:hypothetical protein
MDDPTEETCMAELIRVFFEEPTQMQRCISVLCEHNRKPNSETVTPTILMMLTSPVQVQLTAVGWQPLKSRELTYPYVQMTCDQRAAIKAIVECKTAQWSIFEHAMTCRRSTPPIHLKPLDVLGALCTSVLASTAYTDRRLRVAICNILLQRVQASIPLDKHTQSALNLRLFPPTAAATSKSGSPEPRVEVAAA